MLVCPSVAVPFCQTEVNQINNVTLVTQAHQKIVRFYITMDEVLRVNVFNAADLHRTNEHIDFTRFMKE